MDAEPPRSKKPLACRRCRHRKQKCTEVRPCENCIQSGSECIPSESILPKVPFGPNYVQCLEERVAQLESLLPQESLDHIDSHIPEQTQERPLTSSRQDVQPSHEPSPNGQHLSSSPNRLEPPQSYHHGLIDPALSRPPASSPSENPSPDLLAALSGIRHEALPSSQRDHDTRDDAPPLDLESEQFLIHTFFDMAHSQYPLLLKHQFLQWAESWRLERDVMSPSMRWKGFFVYMVYAIGYLMTPARINGPLRSQTFYNLASAKYLPYLAAVSDPMLRAQGFLLLTLYALHMPSQDRIIFLSSWTIRFCVKAQLHLAETEPRPTGGDPEMLIHIQHRRRVFWCAYGIDRAVCSSYGLPCSVSDDHITVPMFDNIDDRQLLLAGTVGSGQHTTQLTPSSTPTNVSPAIHVLLSRQIESEIQESILSKRFVSHSDEAFAWRARMIENLKEWNRQSRTSSVPSHKGYVSLGWLQMIYYYNTVMLYRPTRILAQGMAGDWSVQACCQAMLLFRKFQMAREIAQPWLGLLTQFQIGVTLLYCFYATPTAAWKPSYKSPDVPDAIRSCSSTLAILAERWAEAELMRDIFEVLAKEVPVSESWERPERMSGAGRHLIEENWTKLSDVVIHRPTLSMIQEMATESFADERELQRDEFTNQDTPAAALDVVGGLAEAMDLHWADLAHDSMHMSTRFTPAPGMDYPEGLF